MMWKPLPGFGDRYEVSNLGEVRIKSTGRLLTKTRRYDGYLFVSLSWPGARAVQMVHRLVAYAHLGPRPAGALVRHLDGSRSNNDVRNLAYGDGFDNANDARLHGTLARGERLYQSKLTERGASAIRRLAGLVPPTVIARWLGVTQDIISKIQSGLTWSHACHEMDAETALLVVFGKSKPLKRDYAATREAFEQRAADGASVVSRFRAEAGR